jgi:hypothetical protein
MFTENEGYLMNEQAQGASSSLNRTIGELSRFLRRSSPSCRVFDPGLRGQLNGLIWEIGRKGFEAGFRAAHEECARAVEASDQFPTAISYMGQPKLAPRAEAQISIRSSMQRVRVFKLPSFAREISFWDRFKPRT